MPPPETTPAPTGAASPISGPWPTVTIVFLVFNRRRELAESLRQMLTLSDYPRELVDVIVVDNASEDGAADMLREQFPDVRLIRREVNCGVSAWNDGFAVAQGDYVLALDDDCYLPADGLRRAVGVARERDADLVSFGVTSSEDASHRFDQAYRTGLLSYWGCAVLMRRPILERLVGYDPEIFVWANELEFMVRFFDAGYRHLHQPDIVAVHMKDVGGDWRDYLPSRAYRINAEHFAYIAGKLFHARDAAGAFVAIITLHLRDAVRENPATLRAIVPAVRGFARGLRHRSPVGNRQVSRTYRRDFHSFASPWWRSRPVGELLRAVPAGLVRRLLRRPPPAVRPPGRGDTYYAERAHYYPTGAATLQM